MRDPGQSERGQCEHRVDPADDLRVVNVPADLVRQRPQQRKVAVKRLAQRVLGPTKRVHEDRQTDQPYAADPALDREQPHDPPIAQQPSARDLRREVGRARTLRRAHHVPLTPQAPPRLAGRCTRTQPTGQRCIVRRIGRVTPARAGVQIPVHSARLRMGLLKCPARTPRFTTSARGPAAVNGPPRPRRSACFSGHAACKG